MASERVRELAREHPEAFENVADRAEGQLGNHLEQVLHEEASINNEPEQEPATVSAD